MRTRALVLAALATLTGCSEPPAREIAAAETALAQARKAGAETFAPERWKEADAALALARSRVEGKDYRGALSAASDAAEKSKAAVQAAEAGKVLAKSAAETAQAEAQALLDDVKAVRREAAEGRVPDSVFEPLKASLDAANLEADGVSETLGRGDYFEARRLATSLKARIETLPGLYREALEKWQIAHGRRRPPRPAPRRS